MIYAIFSLCSALLWFIYRAESGGSPIGAIFAGLGVVAALVVLLLKSVNGN